MTHRPFDILRSRLTPKLGNLVHIYFVPSMEYTEKAIGLLAEKARQFDPEVTIGILNGGFYAANRISQILDTDLDYMKISHYRRQISILNEIPGSHFILRTWGKRLEPIVERESSIDLYGKKVLIVDDNSLSMKTMDAARTAVARKKPQDIRTAIVHISGKRQPDYWVFDYRGPTLLPWRDSSPYYNEYLKNVKFKNYLWASDLV